MGLSPSSPLRERAPQSPPTCYSLTHPVVSVDQLNTTCGRDLLRQRCKRHRKQAIGQQRPRRPSVCCHSKSTFPPTGTKQINNCTVPGQWVQYWIQADDKLEPSTNVTLLLRRPPTDGFSACLSPMTVVRQYFMPTCSAVTHTHLVTLQHARAKSTYSAALEASKLRTVL